MSYDTYSKTKFYSVLFFIFGATLANLAVVFSRSISFRVQFRVQLLNKVGSSTESERILSVEVADSCH